MTFYTESSVSGTLQSHCISSVAGNHATYIGNKDAAASRFTPYTPGAYWLHCIILILIERFKLQDKLMNDQTLYF